MHFPDLEVCCDWSTFFSLKSADVLGAGTREEPLRTSAWKAKWFVGSILISKLLKGSLYLSSIIL